MWLLSVLILVGCGTKTIETKELSCAPQNIHYDPTVKSAMGLVLLTCDSSIHSQVLNIPCKDGTFSETAGIKSCISDYALIGGSSDHLFNTRYVIKPIVLSDDELFQKKQVCARFQQQIEQSIKKQNDASPICGIYHFSSMSLDSIFYSIAMNSCLYTWTEQERNCAEDNGVLGRTAMVTKGISDALSDHSIITSEEEVGTPGYANLDQEFNKLLTQYQ